MKKTNNHAVLDQETITMLRNEKNINVIRKVVSMQANMTLNAEMYNAGLIDKDTYVRNVVSTQEALKKIIEDAKTDLDYLANVEKELYDALERKRGS